MSNLKDQVKSKSGSLVTLIVGFLWFASSALFSTWANTAFLHHFNDPLMHTAVRFGGSAILSAFYFHGTGTISFKDVPGIVRAVSAPAVYLWLANFANSVALNISGITLTYAIKAAIPVFTVLFCIAQGKTFSPKVYLSLLPICIGVALASGTDLQFSLSGFAAAVTSAVAQTFMNVSIKAVREKSGLSGPLAFYGMALVASILTLPILFFAGLFMGEAYSAMHVIQECLFAGSLGNYFPMLLFLLAALAYHSEYILNFVFVSFVNPVTFSVCDIGRRLAIIVNGAIVFKKPLTEYNIIGLAISVSGVLWYSLLDNSERKKVAVAK